MAAAARWLGTALAALGPLAAAATPTSVATPPPTDAYPRAAAAYVLAIDDRLVWARAPAAQRPPASLTKLLTALELLDSGWQSGTRLRVSIAAAGIDGTKIGLRAGETLAAEDALTAMLVRSANDACFALVEQAAPTVATFVARMNARAARLGLRGSHFEHPCGLDAPGQHSSAADLLQLARAAMAEPRIAARVALPESRLRTGGGREIAFMNGNLLVGRVPGAIGVKSGFTSRAGKCVIALVERGPHRVWLVMLDAPNRWWVASGMIEAAFRRLEP